MSEPRAGEGLRATGGHVQGSRLLCSDEAAGAASTQGPCPSHSSDRRQPSPGHTEETEATVTVSKQYLVAGPLQPHAGQETLAARGARTASPTGSRPCSGQEVGEDEENHDQAPGHAAQQLPVVSPRPRHRGEALHAPREQACRAHEVRALREEHARSHGQSPPVPRAAQRAEGRADPYHAVQVAVLVLRVPIDVQGQLVRTQRVRVRPGHRP